VSRRLTLWALLAFVVGFSMIHEAISAHHGSAVSYDLSKQVTNQGIVSEVVWRNPHVFIMYTVKDEKGNAVEWGVETHPISMLTRVGWNRDTVKPGEQVTVTLFLSRVGASRGLLAKIVKADGKVVLDDGDTRNRGRGQDQ
jgi:hypothetical protein